MLTTTTRGSDAPRTTDETAEQADEASERESDLSKDLVFELLKNQRRRAVLHYLYDHDGTASVSTLSEWIAARENDVPVEDVTTTQRKRVYVGLYQTHLPKMAGAGVVDYEQGESGLELGPNAEQLYRYVGDTEDDRWYQRYAALSLGGGGLLALGHLGPATTGRMVLIAAAIVGVFLVAAFVHAYSKRRAVPVVPSKARGV